MIHERDGHTHPRTAWRHRRRLCIASRGNQSDNSLSQLIENNSLSDWDVGFRCSNNFAMVSLACCNCCCNWSCSALTSVSKAPCISCVSCSETISQTFIIIVTAFTFFIADLLIVVTELFTSSSVIAESARVTMSDSGRSTNLNCNPAYDFCNFYLANKVVHTWNSVLPMLLCQLLNKINCFKRIVDK